MGFFDPVTKPFKKAANKIIKPFQKVSDKLLPNELRPLLPYATMFLPGSGILGAMGGAGGFAKMYAANMLTQAMADPEADFEDLNQLSGILSGAQGALSGQYADGSTSGSNLRGSTTEGVMRGGYEGPLTANQNQMLADRGLLTKAADLGKNVGAVGSDYLIGNTNTLRDIGSGRMPLNLETAKAGAKALAPSFAQASGDVAVNYQRPAMREFERLEAEEQAEFDSTNKATAENRANLQMTYMRQAGIPETTVKETLEINDLGEYYEAPTEEAAYGGLMGRNDYEFGGIIDAIKNIESREMMNQNKNMGGMMNGYNMGGRIGYGLGDLVRGSSMVQPVSASMNAGDRPMMGGSGMGGMLSNMINNNPQLFSNLTGQGNNSVSNMSRDFIDLNENGIDDRQEKAIGGRVGFNNGGTTPVYLKDSILKDKDFLKTLSSADKLENFMTGFLEEKKLPSKRKYNKVMDIFDSLESEEGTLSKLENKYADKYDYDTLDPFDRGPMEVLIMEKMLEDREKSVGELDLKTYEMIKELGLEDKFFELEKERGYNMGGSVLPQGMEMDYRGGGFIPMGSKERADDVPARVSKNEFVMTADAVRAAGGGSVNQGAKRMYDLMNNLEAKA